MKKVFGTAGDELVVEQLLIGEEFLVKEIVRSKYHQHFMKMSRRNSNVLSISFYFECL